MGRTLPLAMLGNLVLAAAVFANAGPPRVPEGRKVVEPLSRFEGIDKHPDYIFHAYYYVPYVGPMWVEVKDDTPVKPIFKWKDRVPSVTTMALLAVERKEFDKRKKDDSSLKWLTAEAEGVLSVKLTPPLTTVLITVKEIPVTAYRITIKDGKLNAEKVEAKKSDTKEPTSLLPPWGFAVAAGLSMAWFGIWFVRRSAQLAAYHAAVVGSLLTISVGTAQQPFPDYQPVADWMKLPADIKLGPVSAVATDSEDRLFIFHRGKNSIVVLDRDGKYLRSWGDDMVKTAHGIRIDAANNVWTTDMANHLVLKYDPNGKLLMTLGKRDEPGDGPDRFNRPTDVAFAPNGDFYVTDGYGNARVLKFAKDGKLLTQWGKKGKGEGEFNLPHSICLDAKGRVLVGDRENHRIQVFDSDGKFLTQWKESGYPYGLFLSGDRLFVADARDHWIKVLDLEGKPLGRWGQKGSAPGQFDSPHMLCVDSKGAVYVAEVTGKRVQKFVANK